MPSSTGGNDIEKRIAVVYSIDGVEEASDKQSDLADSTAEAGQSFTLAGAMVEQYERAIGVLSSAAEGNERAQNQLRGAVQNVVSALGQMSAILGTESEAGALMGRMSHFAAVGVQIGSIFGPGGAVVGGIMAGILPALDPLLEQLGLIDETQEAVRRSAAQMSDEWETASQRARTLATDVGALANAQAQVSAAELRAQARRLRAGQAETGDEARTAAAMRREDNLLLAGMGGLGGLAVQSTFADPEADRLDRLATELDRRAARRGGGRRERFRSDGGAAMRDLLEQGEGIESLMRPDRGRDAIQFAAGLGSRPPADKAQDASLQRLADKQKELHDEQMARIQEQVDAWAGAGQKIGATLYSAFQIAAAGQEDLDVAMVKGFKNLAIQFGGQMINEGIGALLTAVGMAGTLNPGAGAKAAEGAGKIALGVGLGAAGAAVQVPSPSASQASTPRLGPQGGESGKGGGGIVVNMNAPSVITGTRAQLGRELGRALRDSSQRFGRASL